MAALKAQRRIFMWHMTPCPVPADAPREVTLAEVLSHVDEAFAAKKAFAYLNSDGRLIRDGTQPDVKNCIYIADIHHTPDGKYCHLLINRGDPDVSHPSFLNPRKLTVKSVMPAADEVQGWSAHMVIAKQSGAGRHRACFERIPGVSSTLVQRYLDALLEQAADGVPAYSYPKMIKVKGKRTEVERIYRPHLAINKVPSSSLAKDVERGVLSAITLIKSKPQYSGPGDVSILNSVEEKLTVRPKQAGASRVQAFIHQVAEWGREQQYDEVQFEIKHLEGNTSAHPRFALEQAEAMDTLYARTQLLEGFALTLESCYSAINAEIIGKMVEALEDEANW